MQRKGPERYDRRTQEMASALRAQKEAWMKKLEEILRSLDPRDHFILIMDVVDGHAGGKYIEIEYKVPITDQEDRQKLLDILVADGWVASFTDDGFTIANDKIPPNIHAHPQYSAYSYRRHKLDGGSRLVYDFEYPKDESRCDFLILLADFIHVKVFDLQVPANHICRPKGAKSEGLREIEGNYEAKEWVWAVCRRRF